MQAGLSHRLHCREKPQTKLLPNKPALIKGFQYLSSTNGLSSYIFICIFRINHSSCTTTNENV